MYILLQRHRIIILGFRTENSFFRRLLWRSLSRLLRSRLCVTARGFRNFFICPCRIAFHILTRHLTKNVTSVFEKKKHVNLNIIKNI